MTGASDGSMCARRSGICSGAQAYRCSSDSRRLPGQFEAKSMLAAMVRAVECLAALKELVTPICGYFFCLGQQRVFLLGAHGFEIARKRYVLLELIERSDAHHLCRNRLAQAVTVTILNRESRFAGQRALRISSSQALHANDADVLLQARRNHLVLKTAILRVHDVDGHLRGVPLVRLGKHLEVNPGIFVAREPDVAHISGLVRFEGGFDAPLLE